MLITVVNGRGSNCPGTILWGTWTFTANRNCPRSVVWHLDMICQFFLFSLLPLVVCHADLASGLNTSAVKMLISMTVQSSANTQLTPSTQPATPSKSTNGSTLPKPSTHPTPPIQSKPSPTHPQRERRSTEDGYETFYGIFQFSNYVICSDGINPSLNICGLHCRGEFQFFFYLDVAQLCSSKKKANVPTLQV